MFPSQNHQDSFGEGLRETWGQIFNGPGILGGYPEDLRGKDQNRDFMYIPGVLSSHWMRGQFNFQAKVSEKRTLARISAAIDSSQIDLTKMVNYEGIDKVSLISSINNIAYREGELSSHSATWHTETVAGLEYCNCGCWRK